MSASKPLLSRRLDRRAFLGGAGFTVGAVMATALVPLSLVHAASAPGAVGSSPLADDPSWNGHVDDACGHWPPYAYAMPYDVMHAHAAAAVTLAANVEPADHFLMLV